MTKVEREGKRKRLEVFVTTKKQIPSWVYIELKT